tara:strand:+ start:2320 stop:2607 length:288 start_codon:yes stop_codon:yes gene_type:complete
MIPRHRFRKEELKDYVVDELKGIVEEAREGGFFSIDDIEELADDIERCELVGDSVAQKIKKYEKRDWLMLVAAWFLVPIIIIFLPFAWLYNKLKL